MLRGLTITCLMMVGLWCVYSAVIFVDQGEVVYVTRFGEHRATYDGEQEAGLRWKLPWPIESLLRMDRRVQVLDIPTQELLIRTGSHGAAVAEPETHFIAVQETAERQSDPVQVQQETPLRLTFDVYVVWRIASRDPDSTQAYRRDPVNAFLRSFGTPDRAQAWLRNQLISRLKVELADLTYAQLVNTDPRQRTVETVLRRLLDRPYEREPGDPQQLSLRQRALEYGIEIVDAQLRRFNHPVQVRKQIFEQIAEQQRRLAQRFRNQGEEKAQEIRASSLKEVSRIRTEAETRRRALESEAQSEANRILNAVYREAPLAYELLLFLDFYREWLGDGRTQMILSLDHPLLKWLRDLPNLAPANKEVPPAANADALRPPQR
ncbi:MAG: SPFH domain-containing protein [Gemmatales bacterium]|nr:SPFH domain-containing protein [Gemmatales bacterium]MDW8221901.1 SPFH domain-containing protein [Gemmatales bacterium]